MKILGRLALWRTRVAFVLAGLLFVAYVALVTFGLGDRLIFGNVAQCITALAAAVACLVMAGSHPTRERRAWRLMGVSAAAYAAGQITYTYLQLFRGPDVPFPALSDIGYCTAVPIAAAALVTFVQTPSGRIARIRALLEGGILAASLLFVAWAYILGPVEASGGAGWLADTISLYYPTGDVVVITLLLYAASRSHRETRYAFTMIGLGLFLIACSDSGYAVLSVHNLYETGSPTDMGWFGGYLLIALAALRGPTDGIARNHDVNDRRAVLAKALPYIPFIPLTFDLLLVVTGLVDPRKDVVLWILALTVTGLTIVLHFVSVSDYSRLTTHLEDRVEDRTRALQEREQFFKSIVQNSSEVVTVIDENLTVRYQTTAHSRVQDAAEVVHYDCTNLVDAFDESQHEQLRAVIESAHSQPRAILTTELTNVIGEDQTQTFEISVVNLLQDPSVKGIVVTTSDITHRKKLEHQLEHQAFHDHLTTLPNRSLFADRLSHALARLKRGVDTPLAVMFIDLDDFKAINDSLGHATGDELLHTFAVSLRALLRPTDTCARLGGDEFAILLENTALDGAIKTADRILQSLLTPFSINGREIFVNASMGIATTATAASAEELQRNADVAMYRAKAAGRAGYRVYEPAMYDDAMARLEVESGLRRALENEEFLLHYQPQVDLNTGKIVAAEALVRWNHPETGLIPPDQFVPIAEDTGLILGIGRWVLRQACVDAARWCEQLGERAPRLSVNLSLRQLKHPDIVDEIASILFETGLPASVLTLELTESVLADDHAEAAERLQSIKELGVMLSIDDFGTGYSSLNYLRQFSFDELKIDRHFVNSITYGVADRALVQAVLDLGGLFQLTTVAEGIETLEQRELLRDMGCVLGQGYLFSRPVILEQLESMLRSNETALPSY